MCGCDGGSLCLVQDVADTGALRERGLAVFVQQARSIADKLRG